MFEKNNTTHADFKASEVKHIADKVVKERRDEDKEKLQAEFNKYRDWIDKWGISIDGAKTLELIMTNIEDNATKGHYMYTHYFGLGQNNDEDIEIIKDILEDYGFNVSYRVRNKEPWEETIATITWR